MKRFFRRGALTSVKLTPFLLCSSRLCSAASLLLKPLFHAVLGTHKSRCCLPGDVIGTVLTPCLGTTKKHLVPLFFSVFVWELV